MKDPRSGFVKPDSMFHHPHCFFEWGKSRKGLTFTDFTEFAMHLLNLTHFIILTAFLFSFWCLKPSQHFWFDDASEKISQTKPITTSHSHKTIFSYPYGTSVLDSSIQGWFFFLTSTQLCWQHLVANVRLCPAQQRNPAVSGFCDRWLIWKQRRSAPLQNMSIILHLCVWFWTQHMLMTVHFKTTYAVADILYFLKKESSVNVWL